MGSIMRRWKEKARNLKKETFAVYLAYKDPRVPWYAKLTAVCVVGYALSPIDLIPDPIPILGYLDDLVLIPLGIALVVRMIPPAVMQECRLKAETAFEQGKGKPKNWIAGAIIIAIWVVVFCMMLLFLKKLLIK